MSRCQQVYYTSCESGVRGGKGFQILAHSEGMPQPLLRAVEQLAAYSPPRSAPTRPSPEEIDRFPVSLMYQRLKDGTPVIAQNRYVGRDYSGRFGNFFMHALLPDSLAVSPIALWKAPFWVHQNGHAGPTLPPHELEAHAPLDVADLTGFLAEGDRIAWLPRFLGAVESALDSGRRIILVDSDQNVARWVMLACCLLPASLSQRLTFDTYARSPYERDVLLVGTTADSDFRFSPHEMEYQFYVFDLAGTRSSRTLPETPFSRMVTAACRAGRLAEAARFPAFAMRHDVDAAHLSDAFTYFAAHAGLPVDAPASDRVLRWCAAHLPAVDRATLSTVCATLLAEAPDAGAAAAAAADLLAACLAAGDDRAAACREALAPWLFTRATAADDPAWLADLLKRAPSLEHPWTASVASDMRRTVAACTDAARCRLLLQLLDAVGVLRAADPRDLGMQKAALLLADAEGRAFLRARMRAGTWRDFLTGAVARCEADLQPPSTLPAAWTDFLADEEVRDEILALAKNAGATRLTAEMASLGVAAGGDPARQLAQSLDPETERDPQALERLYQRLFGERPPTLETAGAAATRLRGLRLTPDVYRSLGAPLLHDTALRGDNPARIRLAAALLGTRPTRDVTEITAAASLACLLAHLREHPGSLRPAVIVEVERHLRWLPDPFVLPAVLRIAAAAICACSEQPADVHRACLGAALDAFGAAPLQPVVVYAQRVSLEQMDELQQEATVASLFAAWAPLHRTTPTTTSAFVLRVLLPRACGAWDDDRLDHVRRRLSTWSANGTVKRLGILWSDWCADQRPTFWQRLNSFGGRI